MSILPFPPAPPAGAQADLPPLARDYLMLAIYVLVQHGYYARADALADALLAAGDRGTDLLFARMVIRFLSRDFRGALRLSEELERRDPVERFGGYRLSDRQRMRRYVRLRALHELGDTAALRDAKESYLRHGQTGGQAGGEADDGAG